MFFCSSGRLSEMEASNLGSETPCGFIRMSVRQLGPKTAGNTSLGVTLKEPGRRKNNNNNNNCQKHTPGKEQHRLRFVCRFSLHRGNLQHIISVSSNPKCSVDLPARSFVGSRQHWGQYFDNLWG